jgi:hypothetical protein
MGAARVTQLNGCMWLKVVLGCELCLAQGVGHLSEHGCSEIEPILVTFPPLFMS